MKIDLEQDSLEWHAFRSQGIGASEITAALGKSKYQSRYELWARKVGKLPPIATNHAMQRGKDLEPRARQAYMEMMGVEVKPAVYRHDDYPFLFASLDGVNEEVGVVLEVKCPMPGSATIRDAKQGGVPVEYIYQLQQQMLCSGIGCLHFWVWDDKNSEGHLVVRERDSMIFSHIVDGAAEFWSHVEQNVPPPIGKDDYKVFDDDRSVLLVREWRALKMAEIDFSKKRKEVEDQIKQLMGEHRRAYCDGLRISEIVRKGAVDYSKIPALQNINTDDYRKDDVVSWRFSEGKDD